MMKVETLAIHAGEAVDPSTRASLPNLTMSAIFLPRGLTGFGGVLSRFNAWLINRVFYPGLPSHLRHDLARRQMTNFSGMITFQTYDDGAASARRMVKDLKHVHFAVSLGHLRSLIYWIGTEDILKSTYQHGPAAEARFRSLLGRGIFRLAFGLEDTDDICADLGRCL